MTPRLVFGWEGEGRGRRQAPLVLRSAAIRYFVIVFFMMDGCTSAAGCDSRLLWNTWYLAHTNRIRYQCFFHYFYLPFSVYATISTAVPIYHNKESSSSISYLWYAQIIRRQRKQSAQKYSRVPGPPCPPPTTTMMC